MEAALDQHRLLLSQWAGRVARFNSTTSSLVADALAWWAG
jgi:hypothetical protein